jgi:hypothetical protein
VLGATAALLATAALPPAGAGASVRPGLSSSSAELERPSFQPRFPIRAAFYYPWFPEAWRQRGIQPYTVYRPSAGFYDGSAPTTVRRHVRSMSYGRIEAGIASWWGQGTPTDTRMETLLRVTGAMGSRLRWTVYYEPEGQGDPPAARIAADLAYIARRHGRDRSFLRVRRRPVVFVYADRGDGCDMAARWARANTRDAFVVLKVFRGFARCPRQPSGWHQYSPVVAADAQRGRSFAISPGFHKVGEPVRLARDIARFRRSIRAMIASRAPWQLITTFNEWGEGSAVESAAQWRSASGHGAYLDALHDDGRRRAAGAARRR